MVQQIDGDHSIFSKLYLKDIDESNEGVFITVKKNNQNVEVQLV